MAKDVFATPIAGVGAKRIFSVGRMICSYQRNRLDSDTIRQLIMLRQFYKLMSIPEHDIRNGIATRKKRYRYTDRDFDAVEQLSISDDEGGTEEINDGDASVRATAKSGSRRRRFRRHHG
jgi:hypothetical protein